MTLDDALTGPDPRPGDASDGPFRPRPGQQAETERLVAEGLLRRLVGDVLVGGHVPDSVPVRAAAIRMLLGRTGEPAGTASMRGVAVVGYATAAWLHASGAPPGDVDVVIAPGTTRPRRPGLTVHEHRLGEVDVVRLWGLYVTTPVRTAADVARGLPSGAAVAWLDRLSRATGVRAVDVLAQLERMPRGRGIASARTVVGSWAAQVASRA